MAVRTVTARGEAVVPGSPDEGIWAIELSAVDAMPEAALSDVGKRSKGLDGLLDELGVPKEKRSTTGATVREEFDYEGGKRVHRGYRAHNVVTVRLQDATIAGRLIQESITRARASVRGPTWWVAPDNPARVEACRRAAVEARRKAEAYAEALGLQLGAVAEVREPSLRQVTPRQGVGALAMRAAAETPSIEVNPGAIDVEAQVDVSFHLEG